MRLFDTLAGRKREFVPLDIAKKVVKIYTCGPSVYSYSHIGNFRTYLFEDILVRYLIYHGYKVKRVMNITDIEDKAIDAANKEHTTLKNLQKDKIRRFFSDAKDLGILMPDVVAKASDHVPQMIRLIGRICKNRYCLEDQHGIYFNIRKFREYGQLAKIKKPRYFGKVNEDDYAKTGLWDFRLWKRWSRKDGKVGWDSPWGRGRPGWHIECSAMAMQYLGEQFDIHCGGSDNVYPHHENEIAQSKAATGKMPARFWIHAKHLTIDKKKMSKRTGNVLYLKDLIGEGIPKKCLRYYLISERYRNPLDLTVVEFSERMCECNETRKIIAKLATVNKPGNGKTGKAIAQKIISGFEHAMDDDLNTKLAFKRIFKEFRNVDGMMTRLTKEDAHAILDAIRKIDNVLGVLDPKYIQR